MFLRMKNVKLVLLGTC